MCSLAVEEEMWHMHTETENIFYANVSKVIQYVAAGIDLPVRPGPHSCWVGACALSCLRKPSCRPAGSPSAAWPSQTEPRPDLMQSGPLCHPEEHEEEKLLRYRLRLAHFMFENAALKPNNAPTELCYSV